MILNLTLIKDQAFIIVLYFFQSGEGGSSARVSSRRTGEEPHIGKYRLLKTIGKGNFAKVKLAKHLPTGKEVRESIVKMIRNYPVIGLKLYLCKKDNHDLTTTLFSTRRLQ